MGPIAFKGPELLVKVESSSKLTDPFKNNRMVSLLFQRIQRVKLDFCSFVLDKGQIEKSSVLQAFK
ncbi:MULTISPECIES: hypothetical protein [Bacillus]|nr:MULTISPECIES: hypothetical protein [Bacillus]MDR0126083.1 hypothetical protein [Bacillus zhangzhouensis]